MPRAKVQLTSSWTRASDGETGAFGIGVAFIEPKAGGQHLAAPPEVRTHTAACVSGLERIFSSCPVDADLEVELPHRLLVSTFDRHDASPAGVIETAKFLKAEALHKILVAPSTVHSFLLALSKRSGKTRLSMCMDKGRYMSLETTHLQPAGVIATKRLEAVQQGAFMIFRAVGGNEDLLEVRWAVIIEDDQIIYQDRFRDIPMAEMIGLRAWASKLNSLTPSSKAEFNPDLLAAADPGMFWSCIRHGGPCLQDCTEEFRAGRDAAFQKRDESLRDAGLDCDPDFSKHQCYDVALVADVMVRAALVNQSGYSEHTTCVEMFENGDATKVAQAEDRAVQRKCEAGGYHIS